MGYYEKSELVQLNFEKLRQPIVLASTMKLRKYSSRPASLQVDTESLATCVQSTEHSRHALDKERRKSRK